MITGLDVSAATSWIGRTTARSPATPPLARRVRGHIAFDHRIRVEPTEGDTPPARLIDRLLRRS
jgi:hypothetical protein